MNKRSKITGRFLKRFNKNQKVYHKGMSWRVCKDTVPDAELGKVNWDHTYYKLQRGTKVQFVRADCIKTKKQLEVKIG
jgi:hypothetical protein